MNSLDHIDYFILFLTRKKISIYKLHNTATEEIRDGVFPMLFNDEREYSKSSRGTSFGYSLKNFEKDKSIVKKERFTAFLREANTNLKHCLNSDSVLLLIGTAEDRACFKRVSDYNHIIVGELAGSFNPGDTSKWKQSVTKAIKGNNLN